MYADVYYRRRATKVFFGGGDFVSDELLNAATIASEAGVPRSTVAKWIASGRLVAAQESKRGKYFTRLFRRIDAQPLIEKARERKAQEAAEAENV